SLPELPLHARLATSVRSTNAGDRNCMGESPPGAALVGPADEVFPRPIPHANERKAGGAGPRPAMIPPPTNSDFLPATRRPCFGRERVGIRPERPTAQR